jgi:ubiquinone/menaquinone biosynthesis C-methylase UbiE
MNVTMTRIPEPEKMTDEEESFYSEADYSAPHEKLACEIVRTVGVGKTRALDIGCGPGDVLIRIRKHAPTWSLYGVDLSARMLSFAATSAADRIAIDQLQINWVLGNARGSGFDAGEFDVIISNSVLHHIDNPVDFWREVKRLTHDGSSIFVRDLRRPFDQEEARVITERNVGQESEVVKRHYFSSLLSSYTVKEVRAQLNQAEVAGLQVEELEDRYLTVQGRIAK